MAKVIEVLPDDQFIVEIGGQQYRALNADKVTELAKGKIDLQTCKANESRFNDLIKISEQNVTIANQKAETNELSFRHAMSMFETERQLRQEGQQFIPHGRVGGFGGKVLNFLDSGYGQSLFRLVIPAAQFVKVMKQ